MQEIKGVRATSRSSTSARAVNVVVQMKVVMAVFREEDTAATLAGEWFLKAEIAMGSLRR